MAKEEDKDLLNELGLDGDPQDFEVLKKDRSAFLGKTDPDKGKPKIIAIAAAALFVLILLFVFFGLHTSPQEEQKVKISHEMDEVKERLGQVQDLPQKVQQIEEKVDALQREILKIQASIQQIRAEARPVATKAESPQVGVAQRTAPDPRPKAREKDPGAPKFHIVKKGESLQSISQKYKIPLKELLRLNKIQDPNHIVVGQKIRLEP